MSAQALGRGSGLHTVLRPNPAMERVKALSCWPEGEVEIKAAGDVKDELGLGEGRTNANFIVTTSAGRFFVRIGSDLPFFGVARVREHAAAHAVAAARIGPPVLHAEMPDVLVVEFVDGRALTEADAHAAATAGKGNALLENITTAIRQLHAAPVPPELTVMLEDLGDVGWGGPHLAKWLAYAESAEYSRIPVLDGVRDTIAKLESIASAGFAKAEPPCFCHFDLLPDNLVLHRDTGNILLVDFEYCAPGQPFMDLAVFSMGCSLTPEEERNLISSYLNVDATDIQVYAFAALKVLAALRETFWGVTAEISKSSALSIEEAIAYCDMNYCKFQEMRAAFDSLTPPDSA